MEIFLLLLDDLDDAVATFRALLPRLLGFLLACALFAASILVIMRWPIATAAALFVAMLLTAVPAVRFKAALGFKTDL